MSGTVECVVLVPFMAPHNEFEVVLQKTYALPFFPRRGDFLGFLDGHRRRVTLSRFDCDNGIAEVSVDDYAVSDGEDWRDILAPWMLDGWTYWNCGETTPDCLDEDGRLIPDPHTPRST